MRLFRLFVVLATLVSLPGYGLAATGHAGGCPERAAGGAPAATHATHVAGMDMPGMDMAGAAVHHDCCPGTASPKANPKPASPHGSCPACIAGHACKGTQAAQPGSELVLRTLPLRIAMGDEPATVASLCGPDDLLRPPRHS
jgi:hypothetical protein